MIVLLLAQVIDPVYLSNSIRAKDIVKSAKFALLSGFKDGISRLLASG